MRAATDALSSALLLLALLAACDAERPNGSACIKDRDCESGFCRSSTCVAPPVQTPVGSASVASSVSTGGAGGSGGTGGTGGLAGAGGAGGAGGTGGTGG